MRFFWRTTTQPLSRYASWLGEIERKNRRPGTSAPTLAAAWAGPLDLLGALATHPDLSDLNLQEVIVEARARFDDHGGNVRNHDLVIRAATSSGDPVIVCVEAKAGEPLGATIAEQIHAAEKAIFANPRSRASARIRELVSRLCRYPVDHPQVAAMRYQLLTAWAGTVTDATEAAHAIFALHEFRTDDRPDDRSAINEAELARFADAVLGVELPVPRATSWCVRVPDVAGVSAAMYVAHLVTDLREVAMTSTSD